MILRQRHRQAVWVFIASLVTAFPINIKAYQQLKDGNLLKIYQEFWHGFDEFSRQLTEQQKRKYQEELKAIQEKEKEEADQAREAQIKKLTSAIRAFREHLHKYPGSKDQPYVMFDLAQFLFTLGQLYEVKNYEKATASWQDALTILLSIEDEYPAFEHQDQVLFLHASVLDVLKRSTERLSILKKLSLEPKATKFVLYAHLYLGDYYFDQDEPEEALLYYKQAEKMIDQITSLEDKAYENLKLSYRLAWAAYRSARLDEALQYGAIVLSPTRNIKSLSEIKDMRADAIELVGDALYEKDSLSFAKKYLSQVGLVEFGDQIISRYLGKLTTVNAHKKVVELVDFAFKLFPLSKDMPGWLWAKAMAHRGLQQRDKEIASLEKLALILPHDSLWRAKNRDHITAIASMEDKALLAAKTVAAYHYQYAINTSNPQKFLQAAMFYDLMIRYAPDDKQSNEWRTKKANCYYFAGQLDKAEALYAELKQEYRLSDDQLELSAYQLIRTREKKWRESFARAVDRGLDPKSDHEAKKNLRLLEQSVNEFANRFPHTSQSADVLLVAASANRDQGRYAEAKKYWERVLASSDAALPRSAAIRGLVSLAVEAQNDETIIELCGRFLKLEHWQIMPKSLKQELLNILSQAVKKHSLALHNKGQSLQAGKILLQTALNHQDVPDWDVIYRNGAYYLAIAGDWVSAEEAAQDYLQAGHKKMAGDMVYLLARAFEFSLRFSEAAKQYYLLARKYPNHRRALSGLKKALKLAESQSDKRLAAQIASLLAARSQDEDAKMDAYAKAFRYYMDIESFENALAIAQKRRSAARKAHHVLMSDLMVAQALYHMNEEEKALLALEKISARAKLKRQQLGPAHFAAIYGQAQFLLAEESRAQFDDFDVFARGGDIRANLAQKSKYFKKMIRHYDQTSLVDDADWAPRARYYLAIKADEFADELSSILNKNSKLSEREANKYRNTINRLRKIALRYHSRNLIARNKNASQLKDNPWIKKSAIKLTGSNGVKVAPEYVQSMPEATATPMPLEWGM